MARVRRRRVRASSGRVSSGASRKPSRVAAADRNSPPESSLPWSPGRDLAFPQSGVYDQRSVKSTQGCTHRRSAMPNWLYEYPTWTMVAIVIGFLLLLTWAGAIFARPLARSIIRRQPGSSDIVAYLLGAHGVYFGILL